ncbi:glycosyltransferase family 4 protein, partial [Methanosphaera sp. WGK6]
MNSENQTNNNFNSKNYPNEEILQKSDKTMKFCMVLEFFMPYFYGGGEIRYHELTKRLVKQGHKVDILTMNVEGAPHHEIQDGINIYHIGPTIKTPPYRSKGKILKYMYAVFKWLNSHDYDIIDAQAYSPLFPAALYSKKSHKPLIGTIYDVSNGNQDQYSQQATIAYLGEKFFVKLPFTKILTISEDTKTSLINNFNRNAENIEVNYIGVNLEGIDSVKCDKKDNNRVLFVGRLVPHKHADHLLSIINNIKEKYPDIHLVIIGKGTEKESLLKYVEDNNLEDYVEFMQELSNEELTYQMKLANVLVLPSTREGFGMVLSEANACHTPTIAYASGGVVEVVDDTRTGYLVKPGDITTLQEKIEYILDNKDVEEKLGLQGRKYVEEKFNWDNLVSQ